MTDVRRVKWTVGTLTMVVVARVVALALPRDLKSWAFGSISIIYSKTIKKTFFLINFSRKSKKDFLKMLSNLN